MNENTKSIISEVLIAVLSVAIVGLIGRLLTDTNSAWFIGLAKPSEFVPNFVFPIMWGIIYVCFAVVIFLLLRRKQMDNCVLVTLVLTGVFQWFWSLIYFRLNSLLGGLIILVVLFALVIVLFSKLIRKDKLYIYVLTIYPMWLTLATFINLSLWAIN